MQRITERRNRDARFPCFNRSSFKTLSISSGLKNSFAYHFCIDVYKRQRYDADLHGAPIGAVRDCAVLQSISTGRLPDHLEYISGMGAVSYTHLMLFGYCIGEYLGEDLQVAQLKEQMCYTGL